MTTIKRRSFEYFDATVIIFGLTFIVMAIFTIITAIGTFAFSDTFSNYAFLFLGAFIFVVSVGLLMSVPTTIFRILVGGLALFFVAYCFVQKESIKDSAIDRAYSNINTKMITSYAGVVETNMYKDFLIDKADRNIVKYNDYKDNIKNYNSISAEQIMNLKLFYSSISNRDVKNKIDDMFKDKLVTENEYAQFQTYIAQADLKDTSLALLSVVTR